MGTDSAEEYFLGCILVNGDLIHDAIVNEDHFTRDINRNIFAAMRGMQKQDKKIDVLAILSCFVRDKEATEHITNISLTVRSTLEFDRYQQAVIDAWRLRRAREVVKGLEEQVGVSVGAEAIDKTIRELTQLEETFGIEDDDDDLEETLRELQDEFETDRGKLTGIDTGYGDLNAFTGGWNAEDLIIIGARPSVGKTAFVLNTVMHAAEQGVVGSIFSLETPKKKLLKRIIASTGYIDANKLRNPVQFFEDDDWVKLSMAMSTVGNTKLVIHDKPNTTVAAIRSKLRRTMKKYPDRKHIVAIDYIQLIVGSGDKNRTQELGEISRSLKLLARELQVPIIALAQLTRSVDQRQDKRPMISDLRESGSIEQDADIIAFLYRDDYYNPESERQNIVELIVGKNRDGERGKIELVFLKQFNKFVHLAR